MSLDSNIIKREEKEYHDDTYDKYIKEYIHPPMYRSVRDHMNHKLGEIVKNNDLVLDLGCGPIPNRINNNAIGVDFSLKSLKHAKIYSERLVCGDVENLPFKSCIFDEVVCFGVLHHIPDIKKSIDNIKSILKDGGIFFAIEPTKLQNANLHSPHEKGFDEDFLINLVSEEFDVQYISYFWTFGFIHPDSTKEKQKQSKTKLKFFSLVPIGLKYYLYRMQLLIEDFMRVVGIKKTGYWIVFIVKKKEVESKVSS